MDRLILASSSPRRAQILEKFNIPFSAEPSPYEEIFTDEDPEIQVLDLSKNKVKTLLYTKPELMSSVILGADTCIDMNGKIIGKPRSAEEAAELLCSFSGKTHQVITGLCLYNGKTGQLIQDKSITDVLFASLSKQDIDWYLETFEWKDVAGGYRIQDNGALLIRAIYGSWYNVMGLPIRLFYDMVATQGLTLFRT